MYCPNLPNVKMFLRAGGLVSSHSKAWVPTSTGAAAREIFELQLPQSRHRSKRGPQVRDQAKIQPKSQKGAKPQESNP